MTKNDKPILIPDFMQNSATEYISMTREEYENDRRFIAGAAYIQGYDACIMEHRFHVIALVILLIVLGIAGWYVHTHYTIDITRIPAQISESI